MRTCLDELRGIITGLLGLQWGKRVIWVLRLAMSMVRVEGVALASEMGGRKRVPHSVVRVVVHVDMGGLVGAENVRTTLIRGASARLNADVR